MGLRSQLIEWKFPKQFIKVDLDSATMKAGGKDVLKVTVLHNQLQMDWKENAWAEWEELLNAPEYDALKSEASTRVTKSLAQTVKGSGKGPGS